jgi:hypothetical protein
LAMKSGLALMVGIASRYCRNREVGENKKGALRRLFYWIGCCFKPPPSLYELRRDE